MSNSATFTRFLLVLTSVALLVPAATAGTSGGSNWNITVLDSPETFVNVSNGSHAVKAINLTTDGGHVITPHYLNGTVNWSFTDTQGNDTLKNMPMKHLYRGIYYMESPLQEGTITFEAEGDTVNDQGFLPDSGGVANATQKVRYTNLTLSILDGVNQYYRAGAETGFMVNVTRDGKPVKNAEISVYFYNGTSVTGFQKISNYDSNGLYYYNSKISIPDQTNTTYIAHVNASTPNGTGVESYAFSTEPQLDVNLTSARDVSDTRKCDERDTPLFCEPGANISFDYSAQGPVPDGVNMSLMLWNGSSQEIEEHRMNLSNGTYHQDITYPEFNTSNYDKTVTIKVKAWRGDTTEKTFYTIDKASFAIKDRTGLRVNQGSNITMKLFFGRRYSLETYPGDLIRNATVTIEGPKGENFTSFSLANMTLDQGQGLWKKELKIPSNASAGRYRPHVSAWNVYGVGKTLSSAGFSVDEVLKTFSAPGSIEFSIDHAGNLTRNFTVQNEVGSDNPVTFNFTGGIANVTSVANGSAVLTGDAENITLNFDIEEVRDYNGTIQIQDNDTDYNETVQVNLTAPECDYRNGSICIETQGLNVTTGTRGNHLRTLDVSNLGKEEEANLSVELRGDIYENVEADPQKTVLNRSHQIRLNYTATGPVNDTGTLFLNSTENIGIPFRFVSTVERLEPGMNVSPETVDYGFLPEGESHDETITVTNTGNLELTNFSVNGDINAEIGNGNIPEGETANLTLTLRDVSSESGTLSISADAGDQEAVETLSVTGTLIPQYSDAESRLSGRISDLQSRANQQTVKSDLDRVDTRLTQLQTTYQEGNYETASSNLQEIRNTLDSLETRISQTQSDNGNSQGGQNQGNSGGGILPLILVVLVLLVVGFVLYTSIIPEEGDPLYSVLGS